MLTYDDLDHFDERTMAGLFASPDKEAEADTRKRRERILACLRFCRDAVAEDLSEGGLMIARRLLRRALRSQQRDHRAHTELVQDLLEDALAALGEHVRPAYEAAEVAALRHTVEREIEAAARARGAGETVVPALFELLARGDFYISPASDLARLDEAIGKFNGSAQVEIEFALDADLPAKARIRLAIACGLWRWSALPGATVAFDDGEEQPLPAGDALVPVLLAGLSLQSGRAITLWASAMQTQPDDLPYARLN